MAVKKRSKTILWALAGVVFLAALAAHYFLEPWGFYWKVDPEEARLRMSVVETAGSYLGLNNSFLANLNAVIQDGLDQIGKKKCRGSCLMEHLYNTAVSNELLNLV